ncbi:MAG: NUDIX hydrolase, partial [Flavobacteriales bacterium]
MSLSSSDPVMVAIEKLRQHLDTHPSEDNVASELYPYGRVTVAQAREKNQVQHEAAVIILIAPNQNRLSALFIKRNAHGIHGRQIAFPGGKRDFGESFEITAIRELQEETGIQISEKNLACTLSDVYIVPSQFVVRPFVAILEESPIITPNLDEIDATFW